MRGSRVDIQPAASKTSSGHSGGFRRSLAGGARFALAVTVTVTVTGAMAFPVLPGGRLTAQERAQVIDLTLERMVDLTLSASYQIRRLNLGIQRDQYNLHAEQARLKSSVDMDLTIPAFRLTSEPK
ncbi:MAG: hypothetical protein ABIF09_16950, partial [Gemmatimonadota bacterium]